MVAISRLSPSWASAPRRALQGSLGRPARARVVVALAAVLALDAADKSSLGVTAQNIERTFSVGKTQVGLLLTVTSAVGALATLLFGSLVVASPAPGFSR